jgi:thiol:disulfide interchange protein DsbD
MNLPFSKSVLGKSLLALWLLWPAWAMAIDAGDVRPYDEVFAISAKAVARDRVEVSWRIARDYYLYNNRFLEFRSNTPGVVLGAPDIPDGVEKFDELLMEDVITFYDNLTISLPLQSVAADVTTLELRVRSQGCLENVLCYPPSWQTLNLELPAGLATGAAPGSAAAVLPAPAMAADNPLAGLFANQAKAPALPPEQAFVFEAIGYDAGTALARLTAQPGYYLYVDQLSFEVVDGSGIRVLGAELPAGVMKDDPEFGMVPVIFGQAEIPVRLARPAGPATSFTLQANFQGCRDGDICYPPQRSRVTLELPAASEAIGPALAPAGSAAATPAPASAAAAAMPAAPVSEQNRLAQLLLDNPLQAVLLFFVAGILLAFTPCVFPMIPILSGIIAGEGSRITTGRALTLSLVYVLAMAVMYTVAGVLAGLFGQNLQAMFQNPWIISFFVGIFIALALSMFGFYELQLPSSWQTRLTEQSNQQRGGRLGGVAVMGFLSALIVGPCVAPPLAAALIVIGNSGSPVLGGSALFAMSMGMGVPLVLFGLTAGKFLPRAGQWMNAIKAVFGVGLLALAIWMLERILSGTVIMLLWGLLAIACGVYLGALERIRDGAPGWHKLWKALGVSLLLVGALQLVGAASGGDNWLRPLGHIQAGSSGPAAAQVAFRKIKSSGDLDAAVAQASASGQPAMLDFYADWCVECIRMERNTFPDGQVQNALAQLQPIKADVTAHDETDQELMARFGVIGPPAILFFDRRGRELEDYRLVGYFKPDEFSAHLERVLALP